MIVVKSGAVKHNGRLYGAGEIIQGLKKKEAERLVKMGACREIADAPAAPAAVTPAAGSAPEEPAAPPAAAAQQQEAAPGNVSVGDLGLQVNPAATIQK